jgi:hypothetical protein
MLLAIQNGFKFWHLDWNGVQNIKIKKCKTEVKTPSQKYAPSWIFAQ